MDKTVNEKVESFHRSRRMFCVREGKLFIAEPNLPFSHAEWFELKGWTSIEKDGLKDEIIRGMVDKKGDVYFYAGDDFKVNDNIESIFFSQLKNLVERLKLDLSARIYGGLIKSEPGTIWPPVKEYGKIGENIK